MGSLSAAAATVGVSDGGSDVAVRLGGNIGSGGAGGTPAAIGVSEGGKGVAGGLSGTVSASGAGVGAGKGVSSGGADTTIGMVPVTTLLVGSESNSIPLTFAEAVNVPAAEEPRLTWMATVASVPLTRSPSLQVTVPPDSRQLPKVAVTETNVIPSDSVSVRITPVAAEGPLLVMLSW